MTDANGRSDAGAGAAAGTSENNASPGATTPPSLAPGLRQTLDDYARLVRELAGENARAITVFGAVVTGEFDPARGRIRSVLVLQPVEIALLRRLAQQGGRLGKTGVEAPLVMSPAHIEDSRDTFPLELLEIQAAHLNLFGADFFAELAFAPAHVRLQCERELKTLAIGMRQALLASGGRERVAAALGREAAEGLVRTLRGMLWLKDRREARRTQEILDEIETVARRSLGGVRAALRPQAPFGWQEWEQLYTDVEALGRTVNDW
ncbi:MAG: hypothetical protein HY763_16915 [Planctomycetes bacterium]|nr:hypothetical protein [Planctomycetota bacterium]